MFSCFSQLMSALSVIRVIVQYPVPCVVVCFSGLPLPTYFRTQVLRSYPSNPPNNHVDRSRLQGSLVNGIQSGNQSSFFRGGDASTLQYISKSVLSGQDRQIVPNTKGNMSTERTQ